MELPDPRPRNSSSCASKERGDLLSFIKGCTLAADSKSGEWGKVFVCIIYFPCYAFNKVFKMWMKSVVNFLVDSPQHSPDSLDRYPSTNRTKHPTKWAAMMFALFAGSSLEEHLLPLQMTSIIKTVFAAISACDYFPTTSFLRRLKDSTVKKITTFYACMYRFFCPCYVFPAILTSSIITHNRARCAQCAEVIMGKCISALDAKWHLEHFICENCGRSLVGGSFVRKDDKPYCKLCPLDRDKAKMKKLGLWIFLKVSGEMITCLF